MLKTKIISSLEKVFCDQSIDDFKSLSRISALRGERISVQLIFADEGAPSLPVRAFGYLKLEGALAPYVTVREVRQVPVTLPVGNKVDDNYLRTAPGLYPDLLTELRYGGRVTIITKPTALWLEIDIPESFCGEDDLRVTLSYANVNDCAFHKYDGTEEWISSTETLSVKVIDALIPKDEIIFTQWFYCDCLANYYQVPVWSEEHWRIIESFAATAVKYGRNMLMMPLLTPALNTFPGFERTPTQLVEVTVTDGEYSFDFSRVRRWVEMCRRIGVKYHEISHFYEQHQAEHSAKIYGTVDGEYKCIFGWDTLALDPEYQRFLRALVPQFVEVMKELGEDKNCYYHISDEPNKEHLDHYMAVKAVVAPMLQGYKIMDALSEVEFYLSGAVENPVPTTQDAMPFIEAGAKDLWVYYACNQIVDCSNAYLAMPGWRTRSIGMQLYKYNIAGFLHWGYNYYNNRGSGDAINPYCDLSGESWVPAGDTFMVYPGFGGEPELSVRIFQIADALSDVSAMRLCERYYSHDEIVKRMEATLGDEITFNRCARSSEEMLAVRECVNAMIEEALKG